MVIAAVLILGLTTHIKAQGGGPPDGDPGDDPDKVPLDPGSWVLVAAGTGYGLKKLRDARRFNQKNGPNATAQYISKQETHNNE